MCQCHTPTHTAKHAHLEPVCHSSFLILIYAAPHSDITPLPILTSLCNTTLQHSKMVTYFVRSPISPYHRHCWRTDNGGSEEAEIEVSS